MHRTCSTAHARTPHPASLRTPHLVSLRIRTPHPAPYNPPVHRFYAPALDPGDETVVLPRDEAEHLTRVLRLGAGDTVAVFDGRGHEFLARVTAGESRRDVRV